MFWRDSFGGRRNLSTSQDADTDPNQGRLAKDAGLSPPTLRLRYLSASMKRHVAPARRKILPLCAAADCIAPAAAGRPDADCRNHRAGARAVQPG